MTPSRLPFTLALAVAALAAVVLAPTPALAGGPFGCEAFQIAPDAPALPSDRDLGDDQLVKLLDAEPTDALYHMEAIRRWVVSGWYDAKGKGAGNPEAMLATLQRRTEEKRKAGARDAGLASLDEALVYMSLYFHSRGSKDRSPTVALRLLEQAIQLDPKNQGIYCGLVWYDTWQIRMREDTREVSASRRHTAAEQALAVADGSEEYRGRVRRFLKQYEALQPTAGCACKSETAAKEKVE